MKVMTKSLCMPSFVFVLLVLGLVCLDAPPAYAQAADLVSRDSTAYDLPADVAFIKAMDDILIPAEAAGKIMSMPVREGDMVAEGADLAQLSDTEAKLNAVVAHYEHKAAEKEAENNIKVRAAAAAETVKDAELRRAEDANKGVKGAVPAMELERIKLEAVHAKLQTEQSEFQFDVATITKAVQEGKLKLANHEFLKRQIKSPFAGMVVRYEKHIGEWANIGEPIMRLMRLDRLYVTRQIDAAEMAQHTMLNRAVEIVVTIGDRKETLRSTISYVEPEIQTDQRYGVRAEIENRLIGESWLIYPGMQAEMKILGP
ncbi:MAG: HlyD family efflux transporter periplasmic adaptor subunit [Planctomycetota bacterium]|nr:HlyD family efflux transporter periplasmic adaptor subunit [Planctomycetota bacterium]MDA1177216.1 HlyD family efflux transporter periplasmic adaptor subunit [Planctomycetota bacterium]